MKDIITSTKNERLKNIAQLLKSKKERTEQKRFVIEGDRIVLDLAATRPKSIFEVYASEDYLSEAGTLFNELGIPFFVVKTQVFNEICDTVTPQGILAVVNQPEYSYEEVVKASDSLRLLLLEDIRDPGNLGTMIRTAEAAGIDGIIMSRGTVDIFSPKVTRATMGSLFRIPFIYTDDLPGTVRCLAEDGVVTYAAYLHGGTDYRKVTYDRKAAVMIGNEGSGLTEDAVSAAGFRVFIPMSGQIESLNASVAGAILMYELNR